MSIRPSKLRVPAGPCKLVVSCRSAIVPRALSGPLMTPVIGSFGYDRASMPNDSGCACASMSYIMYCGPHVTRPLPVRCEGSPGPSRCTMSAFAKRTSSHDESSVAVPEIVPPRRGKFGYRYSMERRSSDAALTSKCRKLVSAGCKMFSSPLPPTRDVAPFTCASRKVTSLSST